METPPAASGSFYTKREIISLVLGVAGALLLAIGSHEPLVKVAGIYNVLMKDVSEPRMYILYGIAAVSLILTLARRPAWLLYAGIAILITFGSMAVGGGEPVNFPGKDWMIKQGLKIVSIKPGAFCLASGIFLILGVGIWRTWKK